MKNKTSKKPSAAIGHIMMKTVDIKSTTRFYLNLGLRKIFENKDMAIVELRGGTHMLFFKAPQKFKKPPKATFDLMVDDIPATRKSYKSRGLKVSVIKEDKFSGHQKFIVTDPDGRAIMVYSSHTEGRTV